MPLMLIIEDNADLSFGLRRTFEGEGYQVESAADGQTGFALACERKPSVIILDLMLPGAFDGFRTLKGIRQAGVRAPVLILTARGEEADKVHGLRLGADDYVTKPFGLSELIARVEALLRRGGHGGSGSPEGSYAFSDIQIDPDGHIVTKGSRRVPLTPREFDLLLALVRQPGIALTRVALLREVWGHTADVLTRTVDIHIGELRKKLEEDPAAPRHIVTVWKTGYRFDP
jgi:DNA-binding response OmpR family regulator